MSEDYKDWHNTTVTIRFGDIDFLGHVNNAKYLTYLESARISYFHEIIGELVDWTESGIILAKAVIDFGLPVELKDVSVSIYTSCTRIGSKSFDLSYIITKSDQTICAKGNTTMVCYNYKEAKSIQVPEDWRTKLDLN